MQQSIRQTYRHIVQQHIVRQDCFPRKASCGTRLGGQAHTQGMAVGREGMVWEAGGVLAMMSAAAFCGVLAQAHLG